MSGETIGLFGPAPSGPATLYPGALAGYTLGMVREALDFSQATTTMYGKAFPVPRLEAWYGLNPYRYGGQEQQPKPWPALLHEVCSDVELAMFNRKEVGLTTATEIAAAMPRFDSCFANLYRNGQDTIGWHADDDDWMGPLIASVSFGTARDFVMRRKDDHSIKHVFSLGHGDLLVMPPGTQDEWEHHVPRRKRVGGVRINLTFRQTRGPHPPVKGFQGRGVAP